MLHLSTDDLLSAPVDALVNPVNCVGVMGAGLAKQFARAFPDMLTAYQEACTAGLVRPGQMHIFYRGAGTQPRFIVNFPTKRHWQDPSQLADIKLGLRALANHVQELSLRSIAVPALGCGLGGLPWSEVWPCIKSTLGALIDVQVTVFVPCSGPPSAKPH